MSKILEFKNKKYKKQYDKIKDVGILLMESYNCKNREDAFDMGMTAISTGLNLVHLSSDGLTKEDKAGIKKECLYCVKSMIKDFKNW